MTVRVENRLQLRRKIDAGVERTAERKWGTGNAGVRARMYAPSNNYAALCLLASLGFGYAVSCVKTRSRSIHFRFER
jgi:hypothetical protein